jgi:hypothetical protein
MGYVGSLRDEYQQPDAEGAEVAQKTQKRKIQNNRKFSNQILMLGRSIK